MSLDDAAAILAAQVGPVQVAFDQIVVLDSVWGENKNKSLKRKPYEIQRNPIDSKLRPTMLGH